jgi:hypothetical protein
MSEHTEQPEEQMSAAFRSGKGIEGLDCHVKLIEFRTKTLSVLEK